MGEALDILMKRFNGTDYDELYPIGKTDSPSVKTTHPKLPFTGITNPELIKIIYANNMFVCLFKDATADYIAYSKDCETWSTKIRINTGVASSQRFKDLIYGLGHFMCVGNGAKYAYSTDAEQWAYGDMPNVITHDWKIDGCEQGIVAMSNYTDSIYVSYMQTWGTWSTSVLSTPLTDGVDKIIVGCTPSKTSLRAHAIIISGKGRVIVNNQYYKFTDWQVNVSPTVPYDGTTATLNICGGFWDDENQYLVLLTDIYKSSEDPHNLTFIYSQAGATWSLGKDCLASKEVDYVIGYGGGALVVIDSTIATDYANVCWGYFDNGGTGTSSAGLGTTVMPVSLKWKQILCVGSHFYAFPLTDATVYVHDVDAMFYRDNTSGDWTNELTQFVSGRDGTIVNDEFAKALMPIITDKLGIPSWRSANILWQFMQSYMIEKGSYNGSESATAANTKTLYLKHPHTLVLLWGYYSGSATKVFAVLNAVAGVSNVKQYSITGTSSTTDTTTVGDATIRMIQDAEYGDTNSYKCILSGRYVNSTNYKYKYIAI